MTIFSVKVDIFWRKSATKFLCVKTFIGKVVRHSLTYLTMYRWFVGGRPLLPEILGQIDLSIQKCRLSIRSYRLVRNTWRKCSIITNRKSTKSFPMSLRRIAYVAYKPHHEARSLCYSWVTCWLTWSSWLNHSCKTHSVHCVITTYDSAVTVHHTRSSVIKTALYCVCVCERACDLTDGFGSNAKTLIRANLMMCLHREWSKSF